MSREASPDQVLVDARGLLCPWPAVRLSRAAREMGGQGRIRIIADDPVAATDIAQLCAERAWGLEVDFEEKLTFDIKIG